MTTREKALATFKPAFICGCISIGLTTIFTVSSLYQGNYSMAGLEVSPLMFVDVALLAGLTIGLWFKNRVCAILMALYFLAAKILQFSSGQVPVSGIITGVIFLYFYGAAAWGAIYLWQNDAQERARLRSAPAADQPPVIQAPVLQSPVIEPPVLPAPVLQPPVLEPPVLPPPA